MIIRGWSIDGYGIFSGEECRGLGDGLTVIHGPNESGKSTLLSFIRGALFGFPDRRSRDPHHPPLHGGAHGGRLFLETADGAVVVEREAGRFKAPVVTRPDGSRGAGAELDQILGGLDMAVFRKVFAFGLTELNDLSAPGAGGLAERLFSAGITGAGRSAREAIETLEDQAALLWRPRGRCAIGETLAELTRTEDQIAEARSELSCHPELVREEEEHERELTRLTRDTEGLRKEQRRLERLLELWPSWHHRRQAMRRLADLPGPGDEEDPKEQLNRLLGRLETAADQRGETVPLETPWWAEAAGFVPLLWFLSASAVGGLVWRLLLDDLPTAALFGAGAAAGGLGALLLGWLRRKSLRTRQEEAVASLTAAARDLAGLRQTLSGTAERQSLEQTRDQVDRLVASRAGGDARAAAFIRELDNGSVEEWEQGLQAAEAGLTETTALRDQAIRRIEALRRQRVALEHSADLPSRESSAETLRSGLEEDVNQWRLLVIARGLVQEALRDHTAGRQPGVLDRASRLFRTVTGGRYQSVVQESGNAGLTLLSEDARRVESAALSRGTAEQLYLCLRLALAGEMADRGNPMPLIMDDALVNADPERARGMAKAIGEYAGEGRQVILFTCHPGTAALFGHSTDGAAIRKLGHQGGDDY